jgi:cell division inhibitor SepF
MGLWDSVKRFGRSFEDDETEEFDGFDLKPVRNPSGSRYDDSRQEEPEKVDTNNKVVNIHATTRLQVVLVKPDKYENSREIADHLREKRTVVLNLENTSKDVARRILDFVSGVAYAQDGKIQKVAVSTYIVTPYNVEIMGDLIDELENNGLYF